MKLFRNNQGTFIKVLSLTIGLTVGLVLIAKVQLESNYDSCIIDKEHVYAACLLYGKRVFCRHAGPVYPVSGFSARGRTENHCPDHPGFQAPE